MTRQIASSIRPATAVSGIGRPARAAASALVLALMCHSASAAAAGLGKVELLRDPWGVPHIVAETDAGAMYGLGYATAEDRAFQMTYSLRIIQGRLAEVVGIVPHLGRRETSLDHDKRMRTFGFYRAAEKTAANLDADTRAMLQAYCDGINDYFARHRGQLLYLFSKYQVEPEPWTPADCIASWWHLGQFFATDGTRDLMARRSVGQGMRAQGDAAMRSRAGGRAAGERPRASAEELRRMPPDDAPAVVKREDLSPAWIARVRQFAQQHGLAADAPAGAAAPRFSHAWVVGGRRTTTGSSVLVSDPQTPVRNPSLLYEFHIQGKSFNARGVGVPGSPVMLIGFTDRVAWGATALGADQADLFLLRTDAEHPDEYFFDGQWRAMGVRRETIKVRGGEPVSYVVRETHLGPVATEWCFAQPGEQVALKRVPVCETDRETIQGALAMMRARNAREFAAALHGWRFPSLNSVFGDAEGNIGYAAVAAIPIRSRHGDVAGSTAHDGTQSKFDWQGIVPYELLPQVLNPKQGFLYSGNHRPIESWYPIPLGAMTGAGGDTVRSWRLRERLEAKSSFSPQEVLDIHYDSQNPARREIVRLGLHLRENLGRPLSPEAACALEGLAPWNAQGASSDLSCEGAALATEINTFFRLVTTELALVYGGGESGLCYFLKTATRRLRENPRAELSAAERDFVDRALADAWRQAQAKYGREPASWNSIARQQVTQRELGYYVSLDGFPSLDPAGDLKCPALTNVDGGTIKSQAAQSYTQWVPMHDPDAARTLLPIGESEGPESPYRTCNAELWRKGELHAAPLSRQAIAATAQSRVTLRE